MPAGFPLLPDILYPLERVPQAAVCLIETPPKEPGIIQDPPLLELLVPGCKVWTRPVGTMNGRAVARLAREAPTVMEGATGPGALVYTVKAPVHGAWLLERWLASFGVTWRATEWRHGAARITPWAARDEAVEQLAEKGRALMLAAEQRGELRAGTSVKAFRFQAVACAWAAGRPWSLLLWPPGAGKTLGLLALSTSRPGPTLIVAPASARRVWERQIPQWTGHAGLILRPKSARRKRDEDTRVYLERCAAAREPAVVVVGLELLDDYMDELEDAFDKGRKGAPLAPTTLAIDEIHDLGDPVRREAVYRGASDPCPCCGAAPGVFDESGRQVDPPAPCADGCEGVAYVPARTKHGKDAESDAAGRHRRSVAAEHLSRWPCFQQRVGLTATPLDAGKPRRLRAVLDLLCPGEWGSRWSFGQRYCFVADDEKRSTFARLDDSGTSNMDELKERASFLVHEVPYTETHRECPPFRLQIVWIPRGQLAKPAAMKRELKQAAINGPAALVEALLAESASRKRPYLVQEVWDGAQAGARMVVFTARRKDCEDVAEAIRSKLSRLPGPPPVWMGHGDESVAARGLMLDEWLAAPPPCVLVGTGFAWGQSVDGLQGADLAWLTMIPPSVGKLDQWRGRFDRQGGVPTVLKLLLGEGTVDEQVAARMYPSFATIEQFMEAGGIRGVGDRIMGFDDLDATISALAAELSKGRQECSIM